MAKLCLIDLSGIFRAAWHASEHDEVSAAFNRTVSTVTTSSAGYDAVAICVDRPPYKRKAIFADYKAHREAAPEALKEQLRKVEAQLDADGFHVVGADGYEADDIIGTLAHWGRDNGHAVDVYSADKDMLQLVGDGVCVISTATRLRYDSAEAVKTKLGVEPELVPDLLALMGDKSDGIPGVPGVGPKTAAEWLGKFGSLDVILQSVDQLPERFREPVRAGANTIATSWRLAQLMLDAPINPEGIMQTKERRETNGSNGNGAAASTLDGPQSVVYTTTATEIPESENTPVPIIEAAQTPKPSQALVHQPQPEAWDKALEPRDPRQAWGVANALYKSRLFGDFPNPEAILAIVMTGRSLGMDTVASLRGFHLIKGKPSMSAQLIVGIVKRSPFCSYFRLVETTDDHATWETKRRDEPEPTRMTYSIQDAQRAGLTGNDQWKKRPRTMLQWRAGTELARAVYPDLVSGLYSVEEMEDAA
jgi:5'-3' exonuclease